MSDQELFHYGVSRLDGAKVGSGRYPLGSGENPRQGTAAYYTSKLNTPRHTGRYASLDTRNRDRYKNWMKQVDEATAKIVSLGGKPTEKAVAEYMGITVDRLKALKSIASNERRKAEYDAYLKLVEETGLTNRSEIARRLGYGSSGESKIRYWETNKKYKEDPVQATADFLRDQVKEKGMIDVGEGANLSIFLDKESGKSISPDRLKVALEVLKDEGYTVKNIQVDTTDKNHKQSMLVLAPPGTTYKDIKENRHGVRLIEEHIADPALTDGTTNMGVPRVHSVSSDRIKIMYPNEGGKDKDGLIELRRGVNDLSLGTAEYAQVRIGVDDKYYLKGMAVYSDDMPPGVDILYYSKKPEGTPKEKVFKEMDTIKDTGEVNWENPFKAAIKTEAELKHVPRTYVDENGNTQISPINVVNEEGDWREWSKTISSQMLSKQPLSLVKMQLTKTMDQRRAEYAEICSVDNPVVKKELLMTFARDCDSTAVHLDAMGFPNQAYHVLLPLPDIPENKIYAPNYDNGTTVALIRYPHGGTFEIPVLTVDNDNPKYKKMIGAQAPDAIGIHPKALAQLSGADTDGDTAMVIPFSDEVHIHARKYLDELRDFDHMALYSIPREDREFKDKCKALKKEGYTNTQIAYEMGMTPKDLREKLKSIPEKITEEHKQKQMGVTTNLLMDITQLDHTDHDLALATKHSMVIIDALKHDLDYRQSEKDNEIDRLKATYQIQPDGHIGGAATLITKAKSETRVPTYREKIDPETGEILRVDRGERDIMFFKDTGERKHKTVKSTQMADTKDPYTLVSSYNTPVERAYAEYASQLKSLANEARKEYMATEVPKKDPAAAKVYAKEVAELEAQLLLVKKNKPKERQAKLLADKYVEQERAKYEELKEKDEKKIRGRAMNKARLETGSKRPDIDFTDKQWEAIQARAISPNTLKELMQATKIEKIRERATPKTERGLSTAKQASIERLAAQGKSQAYIAEVLGISTSTVNKFLAGE